MVWEIVDLTFLFLFSTLSKVLVVFVILSRKIVGIWLTLLHFVYVMMGLVVCVLYRLVRVVALRVFLADHGGDNQSRKILAVYFMWLAPTDDEGEWFRDAVSPLANGCELRLHRYLTRVEKEDYLENGDMRDRGIITNLGQPDWYDVIARSAVSVLMRWHGDCPGARRG